MRERLSAAVFVVMLVVAADARGVQLRVRAQDPPPPARPGTEVVMEGDVEVVVEDSDRGSRTLYFLLSGDRRIRLRFLTDPPELMTGTRVRVQGRWDQDGALVVTSIEAVRAPRSTTRLVSAGLDRVARVVASEAAPQTTEHAAPPR